MKLLEEPWIQFLQLQNRREIFARARQRYLEAGGDPRRPTDNRYLSDEEKKEAFELGTHVFGAQVDQAKNQF